MFERRIGAVSSNPFDLIKTRMQVPAGVRVREWYRRV